MSNLDYNTVIKKSFFFLNQLFCEIDKSKICTDKRYSSEFLLHNEKIYISKYQTLLEELQALKNINITYPVNNISILKIEKCRSVLNWLSGFINQSDLPDKEKITAKITTYLNELYLIIKNNSYYIYHYKQILTKLRD